MAKPSGWFKTDPDYVEYGIWGFNKRRLLSKIRPGLTENSCTKWIGSMSPSGAIFGAWKHGQTQQMTQARRLVWMLVNDEDVSPYRVTMTCGNQKCCNPRHFEIKPTNRPDKQWLN